MDTDLEWRNNEGQLVVMARDSGDPLLDLPPVSNSPSAMGDGAGPTEVSAQRSRRSEDRKLATGAGECPVQRQTERADAGDAGKGNAVLTIGPGRLSMDNSEMPLQLTGKPSRAIWCFMRYCPPG